MDKLLKNKPEPRNMSSLSLAFVGDSVYDLLVREHLAISDGRRVGELNKQKVSLVCCAAQSAAAERILPLLNDEEEGVFRRGRNVTVHTVPKNSTLKDYHAATGLEALFGYLYLCGKTERIRALFEIIVADNDE